MDTSILIIGYGFVGQNLYRKLKAYNFDVKVLSPHLVENAGVDFFRGKIQDIPFIKNLNLENTIVIHTAHVGYPLHENDSLAREVEENLMPFLDLLEHVKANGETRVVYISSGGAVYGKPKTIPVKENHVLNPISFYGMCKKYMEDALKLYHKQYNIEYDIVRPSNIYNFDWKTSKKQGLISVLVNAVQSDTPFYLWGEGNTQKDYIDIEDVTDAILSLIQKKASNKIFNLSTNRGYTTLEIIKIVEERHNKKIDVVAQPSKIQDVEHIILDNNKLKKYISWNPKTIF